ncbi:MAG: hypothetical protein ABIH51_00555 [Patescibacteria group bacterium]
MDIKPQIKKIQNVIGIFLIFLVKHIAFTCVFLFFFSLIFGFLIFYKYSILADKIEFESFKYIQLDEEKYQNILLIWEEQEKRFLDTNSKQYLNPFVKSILIIEEGVEIEKELTE